MKEEGKGRGGQKVEDREGEEGRKRKRDKKGRLKGQQGIGQCKLLSIFWNGTSTCCNQSTNFQMHSWLVIEKLL